MSILFERWILSASTDYNFSQKTNSTKREITPSYYILMCHIKNGKAYVCLADNRPAYPDIIRAEASFIVAPPPDDWQANKDTPLQCIHTKHGSTRTPAEKVSKTPAEAVSELWKERAAVIKLIQQTEHAQSEETKSSGEEHYYYRTNPHWSHSGSPSHQQYPDPQRQ